MPLKREVRQSGSNQEDDKARKVAEEKRQKIEEERLKRFAEEKKKKEEEERKKAEEEKKRKEEERIKRQQEEERLREEDRKRKEEEEAKKAAEERKKKMEADRRKQLEEQALKAEQERRRIEEERRKQEEEERLADAQRITEPALLVAASNVHAPTYDLLGGAVSETEDEAPSHNNNENYSDHMSDYTDYSLNSQRDTYRDLPQRGPLDAAVDTIFDRLNPGVKVTKLGKNDGVYLFGARCLKTKMDNGTAVAVVGNKIMTLEQFTKQFTKVEALKLRGLISAMPLVQFMSAKTKA